MKAIVVLAMLALAFVVNAEVSNLAGPSNHYLPPSRHHVQYLPPHQVRQLSQQTHHESLQPNGQHQSTEEPIESEVQEDPVVEAATEVNDEVPSSEEKEPVPAHSLDADGYRYKVPQGRRFFF